MGWGEGGFVLLVLRAFLPSVISSFLKGGGGEGGQALPGPSPRSATAFVHYQGCCRGKILGSSLGSQK